MAPKFVEPGDEITSIEVISYPRQPRAQVLLTLASGRHLLLSSEMIDIEERLEEGEIQISDTPVFGTTPDKSRLRGGVIDSLVELRTMDHHTKSGYKMDFTDGSFVVSAGSAPFSLYVEVIGVSFGKPEYSIHEYKHIPVDALMP